MEIDITDFFNNAAPMDYSASVAEIGRNAGPDTWRAAVEDSPDHMMIDTDDKREAFRDYVRGFGAWDDAEIAAWSDVELNALFLQMISGDMRDADLKPGMSEEEWAAYEVNEQVARNIQPGDNDRVYYYVGT